MNNTPAVVLTRPLNESIILQKLLFKRGIVSVICPALEIIPTRPLVKKGYDYIIFISKNAVKYGHYALEHNSTSIIFAVGASTAKALTEYGYQDVIYPRNNPSSQALLELPAVKSIKDKTILIVRGVGGEETLKQTLKRKRNSVEYLQVYERRENSHIGTYLEEVFLALKYDSIIVITSIDIFTAFMYHISDTCKLTSNTKFIVASNRIKTYLNSKGFFNIIVTNVHNEDIVQKIEKWLN